jgi:zinc transport system substrate-binding protein
MNIAVIKTVEYSGMLRILFYIALFASQSLQHSYADNFDIKNIFVSILPQKYFVKRIGGEFVNVAVMVGVGQNPATYEPSPKQMALLDKSQLYFRIGVPFENIWIDVVRELNSNIKIVECCTELRSITLEKQVHGNHNGEGNAYDPHVWTSPENAKYISLKIKEALVEILPAHQTELENNYSKLIEDLTRLDQDIRSRLAHLDNRYIVVSHPSWGYYANAYGLIQVPIESDGKEVRAKSLIKLIEFSRSKNINSVFVQKQFNQSSAEILASEIDAQIIELNPLAEDYIDNLYHVTDAILNRNIGDEIYY